MIEYLGLVPDKGVGKVVRWGVIGWFLFRLWKRKQELEAEGYTVNFSGEQFKQWLQKKGSGHARTR